MRLGSVCDGLLESKKQQRGHITHPSTANGKQKHNHYIYKKRTVQKNKIGNGGRGEKKMKRKQEKTTRS